MNGPDDGFFPGEHQKAVAARRVAAAADETTGPPPKPGPSPKVLGGILAGVVVLAAALLLAISGFFVPAGKTQPPGPEAAYGLGRTVGKQLPVGAGHAECVNAALSFGGPAAAAKPGGFVDGCVSVLHPVSVLDDPAPSPAG